MASRVKSFLVAGIVAAMVYSSGAMAAGCEDGNELMEAARQAAERERQANDQRAEQQRTQSQQYKSCLDKYKNISFGGIFGMPGFSFDNILKSVTNAACQVIDGKISQTTQPFNQSVVLPGGVGRVDTRVFQTPGINGNAPVDVKTVDNGSGGGLLNQAIEGVKGIFR